MATTSAVIAECMRWGAPSSFFIFRCDFIHVNGDVAIGAETSKIFFYFILFSFASVAAGGDDRGARQLAQPEAHEPSQLRLTRLEEAEQNSVK